jgi:hypothetical protein
LAGFKTAFTAPRMTAMSSVVDTFFADHSGPATLLEQRAEMSALAMVYCLEGARGGGCLGGINRPVRLRPVYPARPPISILAILL